VVGEARQHVLVDSVDGRGSDFDVAPEEGRDEFVQRAFPLIRFQKNGLALHQTFGTLE
jgi:hypothetical protein